MEAVASGITVREDPRSLIRTELERRNVPPVLDEKSGEACGSVGDGAVLNTNTAVAVGVSHVRIAIFGIHGLSVPARRIGDFRGKAELARGEALGETVIEDSSLAAVRLVAAPADTGCVVVTVAASVGLSSNHVETFWVCSDVCPVVSITVLVVDLGRLLGNTLEAGVALEEQGRTPVQRLVALDTSGGAG